ncbi:universal stress protein [Stakelama sediminis]|uniref:Nucleotide-binding universal stress UspA family protein n=1 Tax=Stakelama sediminis TaxID=463200 RepID=A0A840Z0N1_9SPHN|nr:universal stress protein [Stakelama sediminis]MBB5719329.1 nucleotide-binding universal stress UspA family protein [Stakelama sediminis]
MKSIMLHVHKDDGQESRLQVALDIARAMDGHVTCMQAAPYDYMVLGDPYFGVLPPEFRREAEEALAAFRKTIETRMNAEDVPWDWQTVSGMDLDVLVQRSGLADLVVISRRVRQEEGVEPISEAADIAVNARAPVLVVPPKVRSFDCTGTMVVAWNGSPEAAAALRSAMPLLARASDVKILTVGEIDMFFTPEEAARYIGGYGIEPQITHLPHGDDMVSDILMGAAQDMDAKLMVMGAFSHSRVRERLFGGVTQRMLDRTEVPLLMAR